MRVPTTGPEARDREKLLAYHCNWLVQFERIPPSRREAECADEGEAICLAMIAELEQGQ